VSLDLRSRVTVLVVRDREVFDRAAAVRAGVAALVLDVDREGIPLLHNLHIVFPDVPIVAVTAQAGKAVQARRSGAAAVVVTTAPNDVVSGVVDSLLRHR
jgi:CheY-like chemotaxis protein